MQLSSDEISEIARRHTGSIDDVARLVGHISYLESELDLARTGIGAVLKARTSVEHSIARSGVKELLANDNLLEFYKAKSKVFTDLLAKRATPI